MNLLLWLLVLLAFIQYAVTENASQAGGAAFDDVTINKFYENMRKLNKIQARILNLKSVSFDPIGHVEEAQKPDQIPYLFEGDIVLTDEQMEVILRNAEDQMWATQGLPFRNRRALINSLSVRWKTFPIPYYINLATGVDEAAILAGVNKWQAETCLTFSRMSTRTTNRNGLEFVFGSGCSSYIGVVGNTLQPVTIGYGCTSLGTVTHEIGHALGFYHEQARYDRDNYISVNTANIQGSYLSQFTKQSRSSMVDFGSPYDYGSVMHYDQKSFSSNGGITIITKDPNYQSTIGARIGPSFADIKQINFAYCNSTCPTSLNCLNGGYTDPKNCAVCRCPDGLGGTFCNQAAVNPSGCGASLLTATDQLQTVSMSGSASCSYVIQAPAGRRVFFQVSSFSFTRTAPCTYNYLEIKYGTDFSLVGARFCSSYPTISLSQTSLLIVLYKGQSSTRFSLQYRYDPPTPVETTTMTPPLVTTTPTTTTTTTTTPAPTTTTTTTRPTQTTTTSTTTTTTTTTRPTTRTTTPTTTTTTTSSPLITFFPTVPTTTDPSTCTTWTACTAVCGGCGTTTRRCGAQLQTTYCNTEPCAGNFCCLPFFYVKQGYCFRPYRDQELQEQIDEEVETLPGNHLMEQLLTKSEDLIEGSGQL